MSFLTTEGVARSELEKILYLADEFTEVLARPIRIVPALQGKLIANLFFENSTRTRLSFERAARALSADVMTFSAGSSSLSKGESLKDTALTIEAMGVDLMVVRHSSTGAPRRIDQWTSCLVVNAGDGAHQHPTQALLDAFTLRRHFGGIEGLRVAIVGDIRHSRVARSNLFALTALGAQVTLVAPRTLQPVEYQDWPAAVTESLDEELSRTDVVYLLRIQTERGGASVFPSLPEYVSRYGLTRERFARLPKESVVLHPGPMNRGVEIDDEIARHPRALILDQVANGVAVRMAILFRLLGAR
ncbi:MAG: aspartate carbamoyltransferase catalytic subunit [Acidimicrobiia bacterium]|nr:aspartate carbamoyltransferase catalytic subunit [Acidimicrobiia bacterium]MYD04457.1 aspartate carbamoyltransferase catalytic subunit [Acidimicrobiia bacterium]MYH55568.1 aspartate carbamoyltransferase catalytic subunit [Acidimicrobiia bacterium]